MATKKNIGYVEPADYFPKSVRKKAKIGEFAETKKVVAKKKTVKKATPKKKAAAKKK